MSPPVDDSARPREVRKAFVAAVVPGPKSPSAVSDWQWYCSMCCQARTVLAMAASPLSTSRSSAGHGQADSIDGSDSRGSAKVRAAVAKEESPDLVLMGLMAEDGNFAAVGPMLAELMGIPSATAVVKVEFGDGKATCQRELEGGALEVVELPTPALLAVQTGLNQVRYASLKGIMAAKKKPIDTKTAGDLGLAGQVGGDAAKVTVEKVYVPPKGEGAEIIEGSTDEVVAKLVAKIKELGLL